MNQFNNPQIQQYFETLPAVIQEAIMQSGVVITSLEQMKSCAENIMNKR